MAISHRLEVYFHEKDKQTRVKGNNSNVSAAASVNKNIKKGNTSSGKNISNLVGITKTAEAGGVGVGGVAGIIYAALKVVNVGHDVYIDYKASISGNTMTAGNTKKAKSLVLSFGVPLIFESLKNEFFTKNVIHRQNVSSQYYRDLYFEKYEGNQYSGSVR